MDSKEYVILLAPWFFYFLIILHLRIATYKKLKDMKEALQEPLKTSEEVIK